MQFAINLANKITILRILLIPFFIAFIVYARWQWALFIFILASLTDAVDGYIARAMKGKTKLGKILDPIADKLLILSAFICLSVANGIPPRYKPPLYVPIAIISRDAIIVLGVIVIYFLKGELEIKPTPVSKITTCFQMVTVMSVLLQLDVSSILWNATVILTILSGLDYVVKGSRLLNEKQ
jgi:cardiolipin synthase